ncbi:MAG: glycosyltransferase [bacterium]
MNINVRWKKFQHILKNEGIGRTIYHFKIFFYINILKKDKYYVWQKFIESPKVHHNIQKYKNKQENKLFCIILNAKDQSDKLIQKTVDSILNQPYSKWLLYIISSSSNFPNKSDSRIKFISNVENADQIANAQFDFVSIINPGDILAPNCLIEVNNVYTKNINSEILYFDEDEIDSRNIRFHPFFKPDWAFETLFSTWYIKSAFFSKQLFINCSAWNGDEYNYLKNLINNPNINAEHIPKILLHRSKVNFNRNNFKNAINKYANNIVTEDGLTKYSLQYSYKVAKDYLVSIIIPTHNALPTLRRCLESIVKKTTYKNYEIIIVQHNTTQPEVSQYINHFFKIHSGKSIQINEEFNFSNLINAGAQIASGEHLILLNNDTELITPDWIQNLLSFSQLKDIGAVGCLLQYPDKKIQHAGVVVGLKNCAEHPYKGFGLEATFNMDLPLIIHNSSAVTAACLMIKKTLFDEVNGFDKSLAVAYNDVDFCLKLLEKGYRNIYTPFVKLIHYESLTRGDDTVDTQKQQRVNSEILYFQKKWSKYIEHDPYYNPNLSKEFLDCSVKL